MSESKATAGQPQYIVSRSLVLSCALIVVLSVAVGVRIYHNQAKLEHFLATRPTVNGWPGSFDGDLHVTHATSGPVIGLPVKMLVIAYTKECLHGTNHGFETCDPRWVHVVMDSGRECDIDRVGETMECK